MATIVINLLDYPTQYHELLITGYFGVVPECIPLYCSNGMVIPPLMTWAQTLVSIEETFPDPSDNTFIFTVVPEPSTWILLLIGLAFTWLITGAYLIKDDT